MHMVLRRVAGRLRSCSDGRANATGHQWDGVGEVGEPLGQWALVWGSREEGYYGGLGVCYIAMMIVGTMRRMSEEPSTQPVTGVTLT